MKVCSKCGTPQKNSNFRCIECGELLPKALSKDEEEKLEAIQSENICQMVENSDYQKRGKTDTVIALLSLICTAASVIILIFFNQVIKNIELLLYSLLIFIILCIHSVFPMLDYNIKKFFLELKYDITIDTNPSDNYILTTKLAKIVLFVIALILFLSSLIN